MKLVECEMNFRSWLDLTILPPRPVGLLSCANRKSAPKGPFSSWHNGRDEGRSGRLAVGFFGGDGHLDPRPIRMLAGRTAPQEIAS